MTSKPNSWDPDKYYNVSRWGDGYFGINANGHAAVIPEQYNNDSSIDINVVMNEIKKKNIQLPIVLRFPDILKSQVQNLNNSFQVAINEAAYQGKYTGVFPIKVNQTREVVETIVNAGKEFNYGLEAGSKTELLAVLACNENLESLTVLNGFKDRDYLRLALLGTKMGRNCVIVVENFYEVNEIIQLSIEMEVKPLIGLRAKLSAKSRGKWAGSSGDKAKFGLTTPEIINAVNLLKKHDMEQQLKLFHFHIGSQISDIRVFKEAIAEGARIYTQLCKMGLNLEFFDVGGGLGVDYDGSKSNNDSSKNYNLQEYAADIVSSLKEICDEEQVPHPNIVSESGRAITAHHSCLVTEVIDVIKPYNEEFNTAPKEGEHTLLSNIRETEMNLSPLNFQECYHDARGYREDCVNAFKLGVLNLEERAKAETIYWSTISKISVFASTSDFLPEELQNLDDQQAHQYLCNFSVFQSASDVWAVDQILPIMPLTRLYEEPEVDCTLADITCDSDGKITKFISDNGTRNSLKLHELNERPYYIGIFLTGAYQDVMGDMHNLFGSLNEVHVFADENAPNGFYIKDIIHGATSEKLLSTMQYNPEYMSTKVKNNIDNQIKDGNLKAPEGAKLCDLYKSCMKGYTYLKME
jgi:arginine decarboxylase